MRQPHDDPVDSCKSDFDTNVKLCLPAPDSSRLALALAPLVTLATTSRCGSSDCLPPLALSLIKSYSDGSRGRLTMGWYVSVV